MTFYREQVLPRLTDRMLGNREFAKVRREVATVRNFLHAGPEGVGLHVRRPRPEPVTGPSTRRGVAVYSRVPEG